MYEESYEIIRPLWHWEKISDWSKRIAKYTDAQKQFYTDMVPKLQEMKGILKSDQGWNLLLDSRSDQVIIEQKRSVRGHMLMRARGPVNWPVKEVYRCLCYAPLRQQWDLNSDFMEHQKKVGVNAFVTHVKTKSKFVISARDFVLNYLLNEEEDGSIMFVTSSDNVEYNVPEINGVVRAYTALGGMVLTPDATDPNKTWMETVVEIDLKG